MKTALILMTSAAVLAAPAAAQTTTDIASPVTTPVTLSQAVVATPAATCEMHVWPAARVNAVTSGAGAMFGLIGSMIDAAANAGRNKRDKAFITAALDPAAQARALRELNLPTLLSLPPATVITHDEGVELTKETPGRLFQASQSPCYYDVVIRQLFYVKSMTTKGKMRTFITVRGANGKARVINYKDSANHALDVKLPEEGEDIGLASQALLDAFKADVTQFSEKFVRKTNKPS